MTAPRLIQIDGKTQILPSFIRVEVSGDLYLLDAAQKAWMVEQLQAHPGIEFEAIVWQTVVRFDLRPITPEGADHAADWEIIVDALYPLQNNRQVWLDTEEAIAVRTLGDGYGKMSQAELQEKELLWDWSHVRDSSPAAEKAMAAKIREIVARR